MPVLAQSRTVSSDVPTLLVENAFAPGRYRFELVVVDDSGNESVPAQIVVEVRPRRVFDPRVDIGIFRPDLESRIEVDPRRITPIGPGPIRPLRPGG
ncbi:MAG TPA: hypothetical protein VF574_04530 [Allosphingosinicella sp.]|jgi:hypothetical protein